MIVSQVTLSRPPAPAEVAGFHRAGLPPGKWAALYAAPLAAITSQVMNTDGRIDSVTRSERWPWNRDPDALPGVLAKGALSALAEYDLKAVKVAEDWLQTVLPPLAPMILGSDITKAVENKRVQIEAALDLLAWHLAKDAPNPIRGIWLAGCERTGVLADCRTPLWSTQKHTHASHEVDEAQDVTNELRSRIDLYLSETNYGMLHPLLQSTKLSALLKGVAVLESAQYTGRRVQPVIEIRKLAAQMGDQVLFLGQWLTSAGNWPRMVPVGVCQAVIGVLVKELAILPWEVRNDFLNQLEQLLCERAAIRKARTLWLSRTFPTEWAATFVNILRDRIESERLQPADFLHETEPPETIVLCAPTPSCAEEPPPLPQPEFLPDSFEPLSVAPPPSPTLEVIDPPEYITVSFAECLRNAAGPGASDAEWAISGPLLFSPDPAGPQVVIVSEPIPEHLWFIGDIHADVLSLENAWQFIQSEAKRDGVEPSVVFLGDFIDRGRYDHETLVRLFRLIRQNVGRIIVLAGNHDEALRVDKETGRFLSDVDPAEYKDELNTRLSDAILQNSETDDRVKVGRAAVRFFARCPRALILPDGTLISHAGFPHIDIQPSIHSISDLQTAACLQDFAWLRASRNAPRKLPNRHSRGCEFGSSDFADFCRLMTGLGIPIKRLIRGHDHVAKRFDLPTRYAAYPVLTINTLGRRLVDEFNPDFSPQACVARHRQDRLPTVYRLPIDPAEVVMAFPKKDSS